MRKLYQKLFIAIVFILLSLNMVSQGEILYELTDLGCLYSHGFSEPHAINDQGIIVGISYSWDTSAHTPTLFTSDGPQPLLEGLNGNVNAINNLGDIAGVVNQAGSGLAHASLFQNDSRTDLAPNEYASSALSINEQGQIVGYIAQHSIPGLIVDAVLFDSSGNGNNISLGGLGGTENKAYDINNSGMIVGCASYYASNSSVASHAVLFDATGGGNNIDLGTLGGVGSHAYAVNDEGTIIGYAFDASGTYHATCFDPTGNGNNIDLGTLGGKSSYARGINNCGQIVGNAQDIFGHSKATLFDPTGHGQNIDLNTLIDPTCGWVLQETIDINNYGQIVGIGSAPYGESRAFLLTPIPCPPVWLLLGVGILGLRRNAR